MNANHKDGFRVFVLDHAGQTISSIKWRPKRRFTTQVPSNTVTIFKNFKGLSARLKFCTGMEESEVPRDPSLMRENCWIDVRPKMEATTQTMLKNYGTDPGNFAMK